MKLKINGKDKEVSNETCALAVTEYFAKHPEPKPELRHGDYGHSRQGTPRLFIKEERKEEGVYCCEDDYWPTLGEDAAGTLKESGSIILGNIFDDLAQYKVDLDEFEMEFDVSSEII